jgi:hypothetical protein
MVVDLCWIDFPLAHIFKGILLSDNRISKQLHCGNEKLSNLIIPSISQILLALFLVAPSFSAVSGLYRIPMNPIWFLLAIFSSLVLIIFARSKRNFHIVDQLILSLITIDFVFFCSGILLGGDPKIRALGLYREVGIYIPYVLTRSIYIFKGRKFFYPVFSIILFTYFISAVIGILQQFGLLSFEAVARQVYRDVIPNIDSFSGTSFLNRESGNFSASRSYGWIGSPLDYAQLMATSASVSWVLFLSVKKLNLRVLFFLLFFIMTSGMAAALTRNYYLSLFLSTLTVTLYNFSLNLKFARYIPKSPNRKYVVPLITFTLAILLLGTPVVLSTPAFSSKNNALTNTLGKLVSSTLSASDTSTNEHIEDIVSIFPENLAKVPLGGGLGSFGVVSSRFGDGADHLEGVWYAQILQRGIIIQSIIFFILFSVVFSTIQRGKKLFKDCLYNKSDPELYRFVILSNIAILINTFISGFFLPDLYSLPNGCLVFGIIAFSSSVVFTPK